MHFVIVCDVCLTVIGPVFVVCLCNDVLLIVLFVFCVCVFCLQCAICGLL